VDRQTQQMGHLLDDLLEVSRVTENKIELRKRIVDLRGVITDAVDAVTNLMQAREIDFSIETDDEPLYVEGDPTRLQQIHVNLLSNAAKYTERRGHVRLTAKREGDHAVVCVRDDGVGIGKEMLDSVFELFVQSARTLDRSAGGLGVGLTLARSLVAMHRGTIEVFSDGEGKGSEFVVKLPLAPEGSAERPSSGRTFARLATGTKVLIVEDNEDSRELLCQLLEQAGLECRTAGTGTAALTLLHEFSPDIAVLDVGLPEMDGYELARQIRLDPEHSSTILLAVTGYGRASDHAASRAAGFDGHLVKPVNADQLLELLTGLRNGDSISNNAANKAAAGGTPAA
jgi:two-component system, chemotaxis family, CheB/CheR fusion protein